MRSMIAILYLVQFHIIGPSPHSVILCWSRGAHTSDKHWCRSGGWLPDGHWWVQCHVSRHTTWILWCQEPRWRVGFSKRVPNRFWGISSQSVVHRVRLLCWSFRVEHNIPPLVLLPCFAGQLRSDIGHVIAILRKID